MDAPDIARLVADLLIILAVGLAAGVVCKQAGLSLMVGYMLAGAIIGEGGLSLVDNHSHGLEGVARIGALLLLFSIGIEFSLQELLGLGRYFFVGGSVQMLLSGIPVAIVSALFGMPWQAAALIGGAAALSSTVLVFKGVAELGQLQAPAGRRAIAILLFQDVALVPLVLLAPMLSGQGAPPTATDFVALAGKSAVFVASFLAVRWVLKQWALELIAELRSLELVCLFAVVMLAGACLAADELGLPTALGALGAGVAFSGSRLSKQIDSILLPFRETFSAVFFVTLGALLKPAVFLDEPLLMTLGLVGMIAVKAGAAAVALRLVGLSWPSAAGRGARSGPAWRVFLPAVVGRASGRRDHRRRLQPRPIRGSGDVGCYAPADEVWRPVGARRRPTAPARRPARPRRRQSRAHRRRRPDRPRRGRVSRNQRLDGGSRGFEPGQPPLLRSTGF